MDEPKIPKTKTEPSGGGSPPGKTRNATGEGDSGRPPFKRSLWRLRRESSEIIDALEIELNKGDETTSAEISLLQDLLLIVFLEIHEFGEGEGLTNEALKVSNEIVDRINPRREALKKHTNKINLFGKT